MTSESFKQFEDDVTGVTRIERNKLVSENADLLTRVKELETNDSMGIRALELRKEQIEKLQSALVTCRLETLKECQGLFLEGSAPHCAVGRLIEST